MPIKKRNGIPTSYKRLDQEFREVDGQFPKGFVPILVGHEPSSAERVLVRVNEFKDPRLVALLEMTEMELGCRQEGVLRVACDADYFRRVVGATSVRKAS